MVHLPLYVNVYSMQYSILFHVPLERVILCSQKKRTKTRNPSLSPVREKSPTSCTGSCIASFTLNDNEEIPGSQNRAQVSE